MLSDVLKDLHCDLAKYKIPKKAGTAKVLATLKKKHGMSDIETLSLLLFLNFHGAKVIARNKRITLLLPENFTQLVKEIKNLSQKEFLYHVLALYGMHLQNVQLETDPLHFDVVKSNWVPFRVNFENFTDTKLYLRSAADTYQDQMNDTRNVLYLTLFRGPK